MPAPTATLPEIAPSDSQRFWRKVRPMASGCWEWQGSKGQKGYGKFWLSGPRSAHRVAYTSVRGPIPDGMYVLHTCDNPPCCNPNHLFLGTNADNMADMGSKGRLVNLVGEEHGNAVLTEEQVKEIRSRSVKGSKSASGSGTSTAELAEEFGVARPTIHAVVSRRLWNHVKDDK